ncbi:MAG: hypothetical protein AAF721_28715 [Myxococcota bacterium]
MATPRTSSRLQDAVAAFDRAFLRLANSRFVDHLTSLRRTPDLDLTLCLERLEDDDPAEIVIALRWLASMKTPHTRRAAARVRALIEHPAAPVSARARQTLATMTARFGPDWASSAEG